MVSIDQLMRDGYCIADLDPHAAADFWTLGSVLESVPAAMRREFSFPESTDGFLPFASEYSETPERPDLCERFCYWPCHAAARADHSFAKHPLYKLAERIETAWNGLAETINAGLRARFPHATACSIRASSYFQVCDYRPPAAQGGSREFLQDPHEDGHLFTLAKASAPGLTVVQPARTWPVELDHTQVFVMAGSLLTALTRGAVPAITHAVVPAATAERRYAALYFANPNLQFDVRSWFSGAAIDMAALMQRRHMAFGNDPLPKC